jgi:hypothetical protein
MQVKEVVKQIKAYMKANKISAKSLGIKTGIGDRNLQRKLKDEKLTFDDVELIVEALDIKIATQITPKNVVAADAVNEQPPVYTTKAPINIIINLGASSNNPMAQKLEEDILAFLAQEHKNGDSSKH